MDYVVDITVIVKNGKEKSTHLFKNESIKVSRATKLWIQNNQDSVITATLIYHLCHLFYHLLTKNLPSVDKHFTSLLYTEMAYDFV